MPYLTKAIEEFRHAREEAQCDDNTAAMLVLAATLKQCMLDGRAIQVTPYPNGKPFTAAEKT